MQATNLTHRLFRLGVVKSVLSLLILFTAVIFWGTLNAICISSVITSFVVVSYSIAMVYRLCFNHAVGWNDLRILILPFFLFTVVLASLTVISIFCQSFDLISVLLIKVGLTIIVVWCGLEFFSPYKPSLIVKSVFGGSLPKEFLPGFGNTEDNSPFKTV